MSDGDGRRPRGRRAALGAMPALAVLAALGLVLVALGNNGAREDDSGLQPLFWCGLVLIYGPIALRLLSTSARRGERIALVLTLGLSLFMVKVLRSPLEYARFDELGWLRATGDAVRTGHVFQDNPIAVATAGFPGLSTITAAVAQLTGLSVFHAGLLVIATARATLMLALFLLLERVTGSARAAGIGVAVYACNPSFLYFDAQFGYESLALMLGAALLLVALRWSRYADRLAPDNALGLLGALLALTAVVTVTHHMTSLALLGFLALWTGIAVFVSRRSSPAAAHRRSGSPTLPAALLALGAGLWFALVAGGVTIEELGGVFSRAFHSVFDLVFGGSGPKPLFSGAGQSEHPVARLLVLASIVPLLALLPVGLRKLWRARERDPLRLALAGVAVLYPLTLGLRLTLASSETSQRASEFVFVGVAFLAAIVVVGWARPRRPWRARARSLALAGLATIVFVGSFIVGEMQATRQPGPYMVGAEDRSVSPQGLAAARFARRELPAGSRLLTDRTNATLLAAHGGVDPIFGRYGEISIPRVLFDPRFGRKHRRVIHGQSLAYVVVDGRLSRAVPTIGYYVESDEPQAFTRTEPVGGAALEKLNTAPGINRIYTNGPLVIYDTTALLRRSPAR